MKIPGLFGHEYPLSQPVDLATKLGAFVDQLFFVCRALDLPEK